MKKTKPKAKTDRVDKVLEEWKSERPDLDATPIRIFTAIVQAGRQIEDFYEASAARNGMLGTDFFLLAELRRMGSPYECTPGDLSGLLVRSTGGMTKQLDRIEALGLLKRVSNPDDRRSSLVRLTPKGRRLIDGALEDHFKSEGHILKGMAKKDIDSAVDFLRDLSERIRNQRLA